MLPKRKLSKSLLIILILTLLVFNIVNLYRYHNRVEDESQFAMLTISNHPENLTDLENDELFDQVENESNLALNYWKKWNLFKERNDWPGIDVRKCDSKIPSPVKLKFNNMYWQVLSDGRSAEYFLLNAYYDNRERRKFIRVIAQKRRDALEEQIWCLLYFNNRKQSLLVQAELRIEHHDYADHLVVIISCPVPEFYILRVPRAVSIIPSDKCPDQVENLLRVIYEKPKGEIKNFVICHKALRLSTIDLSSRIIEWIEMQNILGADQVNIYSLGIHPNIEKVLKYYQGKGLVVWRKYSHPGYLPNINLFYQRIRKLMDTASTELIEYYDCFYRNIHKFKLIGVFDLDEIVVPLKARNWSELFQVIVNQPDFDRGKVSTIEFKGTRFFSDQFKKSSSIIEKYTYTLRHPYRGRFRDEEPVKSFHFSNNTKFINHHWNLGCLNDDICKTYTVKKEHGYYLHYRIGWRVSDECKSNNTNDCILYDPLIFKYKDELEQNMKVAIAEIFK